MCLDEHPSIPLYDGMDREIMTEWSVRCNRDHSEDEEWDWVNENCARNGLTTVWVDGYSDLSIETIPSSSHLATNSSLVLFECEYNCTWWFLLTNFLISKCDSKYDRTSFYDELPRELDVIFIISNSQIPIRKQPTSRSNFTHARFDNMKYTLLTYKVLIVYMWKRRI